MNIEYDKIYKSPYHIDGGDVCGYKVDKADLDNVLQMLRTAEQERDQYKADLESQKKAFDAEIIYCDSLRSKLNNALEIALSLEKQANDYLNELESIRAKIKYAHEPVGYVVIGQGIYFYKTTKEEAEYQASCLEWRDDQEPKIYPVYLSPATLD